MAEEHESNIQVAIPWALEGAIRGQIGCIGLMNKAMEKVAPHPASALLDYWLKNLDSVLNMKVSKKNRKDIITDIA
jgi:hypothetical protein